MIRIPQRAKIRTEDGDDAYLCLKNADAAQWADAEELVEALEIAPVGLFVSDIEGGVTLYPWQQVLWVDGKP